MGRRNFLARRRARQTGQLYRWLRVAGSCVEFCGKAGAGLPHSIWADKDAEAASSFGRRKGLRRLGGEVGIAANERAIQEAWIAFDVQRSRWLKLYSEERFRWSGA